MKIFNERIRDRRKDLGLTQADVAKLINKTRETYCRYESGTLTPDIETVSLLADIFKTSVDYLIGRYGDKN